MLLFFYDLMPNITMKKLRKLGLLAILIASGAHATQVESPTTTVERVVSYNQYGGGDYSLR